MSNFDYILNADAGEILDHVRGCTGTWTKGWTDSEIRAMRPFNPITDHVYRGRNIMELYLPQLERFRSEPGYRIDLRFATEKQINRAGGVLIPGSRGYRLVAVVSGPDLRCSREYIVHSLSDVIWKNERSRRKYEQYRLRSYWEQERDPAQEPSPVQRRREALLDHLEVRIMVCRRMQPSYVPHENSLYFPLNDDFVSENRKWEAVFHELVHWTRHNIPECRRCLSYPSEELTAELGSVMLCRHTGMEISDDQAACILDYLRSWLRPFDDDRDCRALLEEVLGHATRAYESLAARL